MTIKSNRIVTTSSANGLFVARRITTAQSLTSSTVSTVVFNDKVVDGRNQYNTSTGVFTCSLAGFYQFNTSVRTISTAAITNAYLSILQNSNFYRGQQVADTSSTTTAFVMAMSVILQLVIGDTVQVQTFVTSTGTISLDITASQYWHTFSGYMICPS